MTKAVSAEHHQGVAAAEGGKDLVHHHPAVEAAPLVPEVHTGGVAASGAVGYRAVQEAELLDLHAGEVAADQLPQGQGGGGPAHRGVDGREAPHRLGALEGA